MQWRALYTIVEDSPSFANCQQLCFNSMQEGGLLTTWIYVVMIRTALVFSSSQIDLVQVDPQAKQLVMAKSQPLPEEAITRGQIQDTEQVNTALKTLVSQLPKKLGSIVLVIPEDAVISKSLVLPKLKNEEIDEAIRFAAEEYLPYKLEDAVLDWKKLQVDQQVHVLFQAIETSIVHTYTDVVSQCDLEVAVVETPALAMVQLCDCGQVCRILVHVGQHEAVLTLVRGCEVIATSVVNQYTKLAEAVSRTILHMTTYYKDFSVSSLQVGGVGLTQALVRQLSTLHIPIGGFNLPITAAPVVANTYLLGISAAVRDITPPSDQHTINLLPTDIVKKQSSKSTLSLFNFIVWFLAIGCIGVATLFGGLWMWLDREEKLVKSGTQAIAPANAKSIELANKTNQLSNLAIQLAPADQFPLELINGISALQKKGIKIAQINLRIVEKKGDVIGLADTRESLLEFKQSLEQISDIGTVTLPASSFVEETQIPFQLQFSLGTEQVKKKK